GRMESIPSHDWTPFRLKAVHPNLAGLHWATAATSNKSDILGGTASWGKAAEAAATSTTKASESGAPGWSRNIRPTFSYNKASYRLPRRLAYKEGCVMDPMHVGLIAIGSVLVGLVIGYLIGKSGVQRQGLAWEAYQKVLSDPAIAKQVDKVLHPPPAK